MGNLSPFFVGWYQKIGNTKNCLGCRDTGKIGIYTQIQVFREKIGAILQYFFWDWFFFTLTLPWGALTERLQTFLCQTFPTHQLASPTGLCEKMFLPQKTIKKKVSFSSAQRLPPASV